MKTKIINNIKKLSKEFLYVQYKYASFAKTVSRDNFLIKKIHFCQLGGNF